MKSHPRFSAWIILIALLMMPLAGTATEQAEPEKSDPPADRPTGRPTDRPTDRPTIGLVLGGGGARGAAHIGVLQVLMEMNVPIDYVAGTSMGSVIGALHCVGMSPDEIQATIEEVDWDDLFNDRPERTQRIYRRKQDDTAAFLPLEWGWKKRIVLPSGAISGQKLSFAFRAPDLYLQGHEGFDNLSTPFRAVTTDLQTGQMFVPEGGNLMKAVRASMSIPGVFPPVDWEGRLLVDGYLARNLPVDVVKAMGADIVIAVDVGALPEETHPDKLHTIGGINEQKGYIGARQNVDPMVAMADIVIQPDLTGISTRDFKRAAETIAPGREAALAVALQLRELSLGQEEYIAHLRRHKPAEHPPLIISSIELNNKSVAKDDAILDNIKQPLGQVVDLDQLKIDLAAIFDFGVFELIDFHLRPAGDTYVLVIVAIPKHYAPNILNFGISYAGGDGGKSDFSFRMRWTRNEMNAYGGELRSDVQLGMLTGLSSEFYQPLGPRRVPFFAVKGGYSYGLHPWYFNLRQWGEYRVKKIEVQPDLGLRIAHYGEVRAGFLYGHLEASDRTGLSLAEFNGPRGGYTASLSFDMLDLPVLPRSGWKAQAKYYKADSGFGSGLDYHRLSGAAGLAHTFGKNTLHMSLKGGTDFHSGMPQFDLFTLGGLSRLSGFQEDQLRGEVFGLGKLAWYRKIAGATSPYATSWFIAAQFETGNAWYWTEDPGLDDLRYAGLVSLVGTTFVGPLSISYGRTEGGHDAFYLNLGIAHSFVE